VLRERLPAKRVIEPGAALGPYQLERELGRGGMGYVYEALDTRTSRRVALKVLRDQGNLEAMVRFKAEAKALGQLDHPNICRIYSAEVIQGVATIAMPLLTRGSLEERLRTRGRLDFDEAAKIFAEIAAGLQAAHEAGLVHRDLKPIPSSALDQTVTEWGFSLR
jgi:serine/threonine protein kinase